MAVQYFSSQLLKTITEDGRSLAVHLVDSTSTWARPAGVTASSVTDGFAATVEQNFDKFQPETATVAMKESEHQSDADLRKHYTAFELDVDNNVLRTTHLVRQLK